MISRIVALALVLTGSAWGAESTDWTAKTFVVWPLLDDSPDQAAVVSWSDWMVFDHATFETPGVRFVVNEMASAGIRTLWWRTFGGGWALYPSQVPGVTTGNYAGQGADYSRYDSLADAVQYGHQLGLKVYAWFTPLEEAHGWPDNVRSRYVDDHPELWDMTIAGARVPAPSFYHEAYRRYKLQLAAEMVERYDVDGLVLDFERGGAPNRNDNFGYLPPIVEAFQRETGLDATSLDSGDPRWRRFRARYVGEFVRDVRRTIDALDRDVELVVMYPADRPLTAHWDIAAWAEAGLADRFVLATHGPEGWGSPTEQAASLKRSAEAFGRPVSVVVYSHKTDRPTLQDRVQTAASAGVQNLVWFETTYLHFNGTYDIPRHLALPDEATLVSPTVDLAGGGEVTVLAAGDWTLTLEGQTTPIARGEANRVARVALPVSATATRLIVTCRLPAKSPCGGVALQGWAESRTGERTTIRTDASWSSRTPGASRIVTLAMPGVPPFLGESLPTRRSGGGEP